MPSKKSTATAKKRAAAPTRKVASSECEAGKTMRSAYTTKSNKLVAAKCVKVRQIDTKVSDLREQAKKQAIKGYYAMNKAQLLKALSGGVVTIKKSISPALKKLREEASRLGVFGYSKLSITELRKVVGQARFEHGEAPRPALKPKNAVRYI